MKKLNYIITALTFILFTVSCSANSNQNDSKDSKEENTISSKSEEIDSPIEEETVINPAKVDEVIKPSETKGMINPSKEKEIINSTKNEVKTSESLSVNHSSFDQLLKTYVSDKGLVNYAGFSKSKAKLDTYINSLTKINTSSLTKNEQLAYWINAYNALTIDQILRNYPLKSILSIAGGKVWDQALPYKFNGKTLTLNDIEKKILLGGNLFDARIHFAVNCAAVSCPTLKNQAYTAENVQGLLTSNTKAALNNPAFNKISTDKSSLSNLFDWYKADFVKSEGSVVNFVNKYSSTKINNNTKIDYLDYNWNLNGK